MGDLNELIKKTQDTLQPLIAKPKLADKLLQKPPFRFLHDIFSALIAGTGFAKGLYTDFELDSANVKEKHQKLQYLDKMIFCTGQCHGKEIDVRSAKIVAGLEPENTNIFLTELALAASNTALDWGGAVQKTLGAYPPLPETLAAMGGADAKTTEAAPSDVEVPKEAPRDEAKEAEEKAKAEEKAREKARRQKEDKERQERDKEETNDRKSEPKPSSSESASRPGSNSKATRDNNDEVAAQVKDVNGDVERTKDMIEKIISKPKMSAKLLSKPPFRFLHDIVSEVTRATGFADGLYTADELDSNTIKEKQPKIDYLQKIINCVGCHLNVEVDAKPAKIVAGLEPDDTNKFLQLLALAAKSGNSSGAVQRALAGDTRPVNSAESAKRQSIVVADEAPPVAAAVEAKAEAKQAKQAVEPSGPVKALAGPSGQDEDNDLKSDGKDDEMTKPGTANRTARPTTARRRPPKLKENVKEVGRLVRDDKGTPTVGIMKDSDNVESDDEAQEAEKGNNNREILDDGGTHGKLIRDILKDQSAEEEANRKAKEDEETKDDGSSGIRLGKRRKSFKEKTKGGTSTAAEINELRLSIQKICQATNPVGKCIEYVYEDMEAMARELEIWKKEYESKCGVLEDEKKKSEDALRPLSLQLVEVEEQIKEQVHKINTIKATIAKNEEKTLKLLRMVVTS
ncbi:Aste57867_21409 [Aphanomyces stellatus]|uniref:TRAF3-interacting protein 1 n=1 Tax=Aphanomyces stellatus TaxID=120398 RepID=A0A485LHH4_9STRA|nr:hypothetical protein As57867_021340 [Aphanomyces stellatus]VFT98080.1 Aste57867_21409 [Aphanomyces stellatus]